MDAFAQRPEGFRHARDARLVGGVEKEGAEKRADDAVAEPQPPLAHAPGEAGAQRAGGLLPEQAVPVLDRRGHQPIGVALAIFSICGHCGQLCCGWP